MLPALVAAQALQAAWIVGGTVAQVRPLIVVVLAAVLASVVALIVGRSPRRASMARVGIGAAAPASLLGRLVWSAFTLGSGGGGSPSDAFAGPRIGASGSVPLLATGNGPALIQLHRLFTSARGPRLSPADARLLRYVGRRGAPGAIPFASDSLPVVVSVILASDASPLPMGGFSKQAPEPALRELTGLITAHRLRFVLLQDPSRSTDFPSHPAVASDRSVIRLHCIDARTEAFRDRSRTRQTLYDCRGGARAPR